MGGWPAAVLLLERLRSAPAPAVARPSAEQRGTAQTEPQECVLLHHAEADVLLNDQEVTNRLKIF